MRERLWRAFLLVPCPTLNCVGQVSRVPNDYAG